MSPENPRTFTRVLAHTGIERLHPFDSKKYGRSTCPFARRWLCLSPHARSSRGAAFRQAPRRSGRLYCSNPAHTGGSTQLARKELPRVALFLCQGGADRRGAAAALAALVGRSLAPARAHAAPGALLAASRHRCRRDATGQGLTPHPTPHRRPAARWTRARSRSSAGGPSTLAAASTTRARAAAAGSVSTRTSASWCSTCAASTRLWGSGWPSSTSTPTRCEPQPPLQAAWGRGRRGDDAGLSTDPVSHCRATGTSGTGAMTPACSSSTSTTPPTTRATWKPGRASRWTCR